MNFKDALKNRILVLDGSMGALLQNRGLPAGMAPDVWMLDNPDIILQAHKEYADAGADILLTNTFGASKWRLDEYSAYKQLRQINARAIEIARKASAGRAFIAGDIGPSGETVFPTGSRSFDEVAEIFYEQAKCLVEEGVDLIVVETMFDSLEFRAALSAVRAASMTIPLVAHATFNTDGITDTGATPECIVAIADGFQCDAVGVNCSTGPEPMVRIVENMVRLNRLPISVQPNAGLPRIEKGRTAFPMSASDLEPFIHQFVNVGAQIIGGCCGTTPDYIRRVKAIVKESPVRHIARENASGVLISSLNKAVILGANNPFTPIGEKMNPSGRKKLSQSLKEGDLSLLLEDASSQIQAGGTVLDLNVGVPLVDEPDLMKRAVVAVQNKYSVPLMIDSSNSFALDSGASVYYGRPLLNSINAEDEKLEEMLPIVKKHGAAIVCLLTGVMVPESAEERLQNGFKIAERLKAIGFEEKDFVFDCLGLVVSAMRNGSMETLRTIELIKKTFPKSATTLGLSNVSFGLPNRSFVHNAFLACAAQRGLDSAIMSVTDPFGKALAAAADMWGHKAGAIENFIGNFAEKIEVGTSGKTEKKVQTEEEKSKVQEPAWVAQLPELQQNIFRGIVGGQKDLVLNSTKQFADETPDKAMDLFIDVMTPAIRHLGNLFAARVKFIPHLIAAADAMKTGVAVLEPLLIKKRAEQGGKGRGTIIFATVKGDIHDIGKNICVLMLRNFGFEVIDLGRNVDAEVILESAKEKNASVVALSALMTTTMMQMKVVIDAVKERKLPYKVVIGGAVVTPEFAREIQADGFSTDVGTVVSEMERMIQILDAVGVNA